VPGTAGTLDERARTVQGVERIMNFTPWTRERFDTALEAT
jgi:hypothetical protein